MIINNSLKKNKIDFNSKKEKKKQQNMKIGTKQ